MPYRLGIADGMSYCLGIADGMLYYVGIADSMPSAPLQTCRYSLWQSRPELCQLCATAPTKKTGLLRQVLFDGSQAISPPQQVFVNCRGPTAGPFPPSAEHGRRRNRRGQPSAITM